MTTYQAATGHDNAGSLADLSPQPASEGIEYPEWVSAVGGGVTPHGAPFIELVWSGGISSTEASAILAALGLAGSAASGPQTADVTVRVPDEMRNFANYNGVAVRPTPGDGMKWQPGAGWYRTFKVVVKDLEALS
jgi:hypothetical protein